MCFNLKIQVKNLSKRYQIYNHPSDRLRQSLYSGLNRLFGKNPKQLFREFWVLRNISFEILKGESVGIIGQNGSGKSTLLQLICGTLNPTLGFIKTYGRISALLDLGSSFNLEFSGRENVYMSGAILGLTEAEIDERFEEILAFADIGNFIDQATKTYSSGMLVRLAFAVQVCIEPDILIVDEALAVGDALFQKKCFERMNQLRSNGTTLLLVSHDQEAIRTMTEKVVFLDRGIVKFFGTSTEALLEYRKFLHEFESKRFHQIDLSYKEKKKLLKTKSIEKEKKYQAKSKKKISLNMALHNEKEIRYATSSAKRLKPLSFGDLDAEIINVFLLNEQEESCSHFDPRDKIIIIVQCKAYIELTHLNVGLRIRNKEGVKIYSWGTLNQDMAILKGVSMLNDIFWNRVFSQDEYFDIKFEFICGIGPNLYEIQASITEEKKPYYAEQRIIHWIDEAAFFTVSTESRSYHFGGVVDLRMTSNLISNYYQLTR